nr:immunoglobulin heavy chain junction region [Mus musculus]
CARKGDYAMDYW